jgi:uncharacterized membrane protein YesL
VTLRVVPTTLRKNVYYYKIYYVYLNTFFASVLPLGLLLFFNISTAIELIKMSRQVGRLIVFATFLYFFRAFQYLKYSLIKPQSNLTLA